jgi:polysaccharide export outer membrane protein
MVGDGAHVVAARVLVGSNHARYSCVPVCGHHHIAISPVGGRINRRSERASGLPLLGSIHLAGLTPTQAASKVTELYSRDYLVNPKINVTLVNYGSRRFTILGQINKPGIFEKSPDGIDLLEAVAMAGGYTRIAAPERITVRRRTASGDQILKVNAKRFTKGKGGGFRVEPGDTITVAESIF